MIELQTEEQTMLGWAEQAPINIKRLDWLEESIRDRAEGEAVVQRFAYLDRCEGRGEYVDPESYNLAVADSDRALVNFLRHNCSNYDALLAELESWDWFYERECNECGDQLGDQLGDDDDDDSDEMEAFNDEKDDAYETIRRRVHTALAEAYPQFAELIADNDDNA